jgi:hypothetical protein
LPGSYCTSTAPVERLHFDPENPRLPPSLRNTEDPEAILRWMLADASLLEIMGSIADQGFFPGDPLLVSPYPDEPESEEARDPMTGGDWVVVEGNRRYASLELLRDPDRAPRRRAAVRQLAEEAKAPLEETVPVVAFPNRGAILTYHGYRHITGIKEWVPLEKARFLDQLRVRAMEIGDPYDNRTLARQIGSKGPYVGRLLAALHALRKLTSAGYFEEFQVDEEDIHFSLLSTAFNYENIVEFLELEAADDPDLSGLNDDRLRLLARWIFVSRDEHGTALEESRNMRYLNAVVTKGAAIEALEGGARVEAAALLAFDPDELFLEAVNQAAPPMAIARKNAEHVEHPDRGAFTTVQEIGQQASEIEEELRPRLNGTGADGG